MGRERAGKVGRRARHLLLGDGGSARIYLLTIYGKSERSDIDRETLRRIAGKLELLE